MTNAALKPLHWYWQHVGAREHGLPAGYIKTIRRVETISDANPAREQAELAIYR